MKILVTGSSGKFGSVIVNRLKDFGHQVIGTDSIEYLLITHQVSNSITLNRVILKLNLNITRFNALKHKKSGYLIKATRFIQNNKKKFLEHTDVVVSCFVN